MLEQLITEHIVVIQSLREQNIGIIRQAGEYAADTLHKGHTIFFCGNGGSAADSQHLAAEIVGRFQAERLGYPAVALSADSSVLTSISNDYGYKHVFARQIQALGRPGDMLVGLSTSGNSPNMLAAIRQARAMGLFTIGMTGKDGGHLAGLVDLCIRAPSDKVARVQEAHILIGHLICEVIDERLYARGGENP